MAEIRLDPGEWFEHTHASASVTELVSGSVLFRCGDSEKVLAPGDTVEVPAGVCHSSENLGATAAVLKCMDHSFGHQPKPKPKVGGSENSAS